MKNPTNITNPPSITKTHNFPSSSIQNTSTVPQKIPPSKLSKPPIFPFTSHTSHQPFLQEMQDDHTANKDKDKHACDRAAKDKSKFFKLRRRASLPEWLGTIKFDDKEEVLTIDADGKKRLISGPILLMEVWNNNGVKYVVHFNDFCQPIRKGGHILVQFLGSIAKEERFCPLSDKSWRKLDTSFKEDISKAIREDVKAKAESLKLAYPDGSKLCIDIENEAFEATLYAGLIPEKPRGFGFGVRSGDIYEVRGVLRKEGIGKGTRVVEMDSMSSEVSSLKEEIKELHKQNEEIKGKCDENTKLLKTMTTLFSQVLESFLSGEGSSQLLDTAQLALLMANPQVSNDSVDHGGGRFESRDAY